VHSSNAYGFELDTFQLDAIGALEAGESVLVAAPTGSGKTVVAERSIELALEAGAKAFYTTPIKALSNQKYHDLVRRHGARQIGLLTGDNTINGDAPVVVMTTEVLRNMVYARSSALERLMFVVLDEVHYLQDAYRGPVWEEVIIHLPPEVRLVCLSATVSNADELTEWITTVRGPTRTVVEQRRPVELENLFAVDDRQSGDLVVVPTLVEGRANPDGRRFDVDPREGGRSRTRRRFATPNRVEIVELLRERSLLPAIAFIFSRAACDDAVDACLRAGVRLTGPAERARIRQIADDHTDALSDDDLAVLGHGPWLAALEAGIAAHHAGMVPPFKEAVEACFVEGLVKVVFATETLALGINMPARSVVIEKLTKFTGERHEFLTPAQYTQLTGRAGRRGIDEAGTAVVLWSPFVSFDDVATLASSRAFRLTSSFKPTYNMAVNLVRRYPADRAHHLLNLSFAQYQSDRAVVQLEARLAKRKDYLAELRAAATCELGDIDEYAELIAARRRAPSPPGLSSLIDAALQRIKPGDVIWVAGGKSGGKVAVLSVSQRKGGHVRLRAITPGRRVVSLGASDFDQPPVVLTALNLPTPFAPQSTSFQKSVSRALSRVDVAKPARASSASRPSPEDEPADHPVDRCADRESHLRARRQAARVAREVDDLKRQIRGHSESLARLFDRVLQLLETWGFLDGWSLTRKGELLGRVFHECDLLVTEALELGLFDGLSPGELAGLLSVFTYEHRSSTPPVEPWFPSAALRHRFQQIEQLAADLNADERHTGLTLTRAPDAGFVASAHAWAAGQSLDDVMADEELSPGDFVRNVKQLLDLLRQIADAAGNPATARAARQASEQLFRGVIAASTAIGGGDVEADTGATTSPDPEAGSP
jgi:ATP-dependent RNA helicase HelY